MFDDLLANTATTAQLDSHQKLKQAIKEANVEFKDFKEKKKEDNKVLYNNKDLIL